MGKAELTVVCFKGKTSAPAMCSLDGKKKQINIKRCAVFFEQTIPQPWQNTAFVHDKCCVLSD